MRGEVADGNILSLPAEACKQIARSFRTRLTERGLSLLDYKLSSISLNVVLPRSTVAGTVARRRDSGLTQKME